MLQSNEYDLICIGSGPAGQRAAIQAAKLGKKAVVIEKQRAIGGVCIETGTIPSKTFREAVQRLYAPTNLDGSDVNVYVAQLRPTMQQLIGQIGRVMQREMQTIIDALRRNNVDLVQGRASFVDPHTVQVDTPTGLRRLTADYIVSLQHLPRTLAVVGAGVIGIEYASMFAALGVPVTVIDQRPRPLEFLDQE